MISLSEQILNFLTEQLSKCDSSPGNQVPQSSIFKVKDSTFHKTEKFKINNRDNYNKTQKPKT